jgi:hypothetical protein
VPPKPAWGKSFINGGFKQNLNLMSLWDVSIGPNTTAVVVCAGTLFPIASVECIAQSVQAGNDVLHGNAEGTANEILALEEVSLVLNLQAPASFAT